MQYRSGLYFVKIKTIFMHEASQQIPGFIKTLEPLLKNYGYLGVGGLLVLEDFGLPVPGETVLIAASFYAGLGQLNIFLIGIVAFCAALLGDNIGFAIGKYGGHPLIDKFGKYIFLTPKRVKRAEDFFRRHGGKIIVVARFIDGLRQANGIIAGLSEMLWRRFLAFNAIGAALWVSVWCTVGYFGGSHIKTFLRYQLYFTIVIALIAAFLIARFFIKKRAKKS
jgi:membrane protein DedA with SNARE-associated domain